MKKNSFYTAAILLLWFLFVSCSPEAGITKSIEGQESAILAVLGSAADSRTIPAQLEEGYLDTLDPNDSVLAWERRNWLYDLNTAEAEGYALDVREILSVDAGIAEVELTEIYSVPGGSEGASRRIEREMIRHYVKRRGGWFDSGTALDWIQTEHFLILHQDLPDWKLTSLEREMEAAYTETFDRYGAEPGEKTEVKLFMDRKDMVYSVMASPAWMFSGWYDYPASIKLYVGEKPVRAYADIFSHELIHRITLEEAKRNLPYWFAEGLAVYFADFENRGDPIRDEGGDPDLLRIPVTELARIDLTKLTEGRRIFQYYRTSGLVVRAMTERFGEDGVKGLVRGLGEYGLDRTPEMDPGSDVERQRRFEDALREVAGMTMADLDALYLEWFDGTYNSN